MFVGNCDRTRRPRASHAVRDALEKLAQERVLELAEDSLVRRFVSRALHTLEPVEKHGNETRRVAPRVLRQHENRARGTRRRIRDVLRFAALAIEGHAKMASSQLPNELSHPTTGSTVVTDENLVSSHSANCNPVRDDRRSERSGELRKRVGHPHDAFGV